MDNLLEYREGVSVLNPDSHGMRNSLPGKGGLTGWILVLQRSGQVYRLARLRADVELAQVLRI